MKIIALAFAAAAMLATPAFAQDINVRVGTPDVRVGVPGVRVTTDRDRHRDRVVVRRQDERCKTVTVRERRGDVTIVKKRSTSD